MNLFVLERNIGGENMKFRNCFFEYDGVYSGKYNLRLVYVENSNHNFDSGGGFDFKFGQIPYSHEQLYYGKDYSANPLQFEIEILNIDGYITDEQMIEIKEWLFGGNGWKKFKPLNGKNNKSLRCILTPIADITEGNHYKGLRFSLRNASPFWYGEEQTINKNSGFYYANSNWYYVFQIDVPYNDNVDCEIFPKITVGIDRSQNTGSAFDRGKRLILENTSVKTIAEAQQVSNSKFVYPATSRIELSTDYIENNAEVISYNCNLDSSDNKYYIQITYSGGGFRIPTDMTTQPTQEQILTFLNNNGYYSQSFDTDNQTGTAIYADDNITIDTRYVIFSSEQHPNAEIEFLINENDTKKVLRLHYGTNILRISYPWALKDITFKYTPLYRMGAF